MGMGRNKVTRYKMRLMQISRMRTLGGQDPLAVLIDAPADRCRRHMAQNSGLQALSEARNALTFIDQLEGLN